MSRWMGEALCPYPCPVSLKLHSGHQGRIDENSLALHNLWRSYGVGVEYYPFKLSQKGGVKKKCNALKRG